jgi:hypothetical protein
MKANTQQNSISNRNVNSAIAATLRLALIGGFVFFMAL